MERKDVRKTAEQLVEGIRLQNERWVEEGRHEGLAFQYRHLDDLTGCTYISYQKATILTVKWDPTYRVPNVKLDYQPNCDVIEGIFRGLHFARAIEVREVLERQGLEYDLWEEPTRDEIICNFRKRIAELERAR